ncbi:Bug family tripartite tricarboxylate transporter substrate binding protein [Spirochaeta isovalerica]|uniref:Putative tricarboxylic transport membrane protein n=1 Tax=Spirochaeta isovalerica TaxID=150 RepID=A0A841RA19_9SPIO|nr:tripartite tricarboxylate transporter substrate binding protein [Spirochaeta isovalerica]MBB6480211.1 putative tricarboxylic transport membrane protein [Spirochaeta isovalerica]
MKKTLLLFTALLILSPLALMANGQQGESGQTVQYPKGNLDFVAPSGAGGGWDLTIRTTAKVLKDTGLVRVPMPVRNNPGAGGSVHLASLQEKKGDDKTITVYSSPLILTKLAGTTDLDYNNVTPLARLIADYAVFVVKADSPYKSINDVMDALKSNVKSVKIGGTSSAGSMDHLQFLIMAKAAGVKNLKEIDYVSFDDSGAAQVLGGHIDLFSTGLSEVQGLIQSGDLRALAQTAPHRVGEGVVAEIPTCMEAGINETFVNWRGLFGPPEMPEYAVDYWRETLGKLRLTPEWEAARKTNGWDDAYMDAPEFSEFLVQADNNFRDILNEIGMLQN